MDIYLMAVQKGSNSTYQPAYQTTGTKLEGQLKAPTDILNPVFSFLPKLKETDTMANICRYNYCYIPDLSRYYWIKDWVLQENFTTAYMTVDVLASWKTQLLANSCYVLRAASDYNGFIKDTKYPVTAGAPTVTGSVFQGTNYNPLNPAANSYGIYILGIINSRGSLSGCVEYYAMSYLTFMNFCQQLFTISNIWGSQGADLADALKEAITDPFQYIVSVVWLPYDIYDFGARQYVTGTNTVYVGYNQFTTTGQAWSFTNSVLAVEFTNVVGLTIPRHPLDVSRGAYMDLEPFSRYWCSFYPFADQIELDSTLLQGKSTLYFLYTIDLRTGKGICNITTDFTGSDATDWRAVRPLRVIEAQVGVPIPIAAIHTSLPQSLGQLTMNAVAAAGSEFGGFKQLFKRLSSSMAKAMGNWMDLPEDAMQQVYENIGAEPITAQDTADVASATLAMKSTAEITGSQGTISFFSRQVCAIWGAFYNPAPDDLARFGRPLCSSRVLNTLSGFVMCERPKNLLVNQATITELTEMANLLAEGIYIE